MGMLKALFALMVLFVAGIVAFGVVGSIRTSSVEGALIPQIPVRKIVGQMKGGGRVVFVDVREPAEFREYHIPTALNFPARRLTLEGKGNFTDADYVVPYCLKDFRGFEGGKRLLKLGVKNVYLIEGFGINTWKQAGMPVSGRLNGKSDAGALEELWRIYNASGQGK